jgi:S-adenosylmethionine:tRNA ribosyltransferase-isomerase
VREKRPVPGTDYSYDLPQDRIAKYPLQQRDQSRLLVYNKGTISETIFRDISIRLPEGSRLFINNTRVIHARLLFRNRSGAKIEIFCLAPCDPPVYEKAFAAAGAVTWKCIAGNLKKWKQDTLSLTLNYGGKEVILNAKKVQIKEGEVIVLFSWNSNLTFAEVIDLTGAVPIPPYLNRDAEPIDNTRYQTIYSKKEGSVAAPTAGLHFTDDVMHRLVQKNTEIREVTLHVGAGTFQPVKVTDAREHTMHSEWFTVTADTIRIMAEDDKPVIATGTTTLRTLESLYWIAVLSKEKNRIANNLGQWEWTDTNSDMTCREAFRHLYSILQKNNLPALSAHTSLMIVPGYRFRVADILITNFHQPRSTLLMLVAAFAGNDWKKVYDYALKHNFRFLSYGDSSLVFRNEES